MPIKGSINNVQYDYVLSCIISGAFGFWVSAKRVGGACVFSCVFGWDDYGRGSCWDGNLLNRPQQHHTWRVENRPNHLDSHHDVTNLFHNSSKGPSPKPKNPLAPPHPSRHPIPMARPRSSPLHPNNPKHQTKSNALHPYTIEKVIFRAKHHKKIILRVYKN
jgi:hypothetical protein